MDDKLHQLVKLLDDKLAKDIKVIDMHNASPLYDYFVIVSVDTIRQSNALVSYIDELADKNGYTIKSIQGNKESEWVLIDMQDVIIHIFTPNARNTYNLEKLWSDCTILQPADLGIGNE